MPARPDRLDLALAAGTAVLLLVWGVAGTPDGLAAWQVPVLLAAAAPLAWSRRAPRLVLALTGAQVFSLLELVKEVWPVVGVAPGLAAFGVARHTDRRTTLLAAGAATALVVAGELLYSPHPLLHPDTFKNLGLALGALAWGTAVRERACHLAAIEQRIATEAARAAQAERLAIAQDVHDVVAHAIVAINVQAGVAAHLVDRRPEAAHDALTEIKRVSGEALADLRSTLGLLRADVPTRPAPGFAALDELADAVRAAGIDVAVSVRGEDRLPPAVQSAGYRIVQEALTNVLRHSGGHRAAVDVEVGPDAVRIDVRDDGAGAAGPGGTGNGLRGMRERAAAVGGAVQAGPARDGGWRVQATLPVA